MRWTMTHILEAAGSGYSRYVAPRAVNADARQASTARKRASSSLIFRNVSNCPAYERRLESSSAAEERTATRGVPRRR